MRGRRRSLRPWLVPIAVLSGVVGVATVPGWLSSASAGTPQLAPLSPAQLLAKMHDAQPGPFSGQIELDASLGLPSVPNVMGASDTLTGLLAGVHDARIWFGGPDRVRVALPAPLAETNWIRNGADLWSWDSQSQRAVHATVPADPGPGAAKAEPKATPKPDRFATGPAVTPAQLADDVLARITPSTDVTVGTAGYVAGRPVYTLSVSPKSATSTIGSIVVAVDAATGLPLDVRITPRGSTSAALDLGFTHISFSAPAASNFDFTPPPGANVVQAQSPSQLLGGGWGRFGGPGGAVGPGGPRRKVRPAPPGTPGGQVPAGSVRKVPAGSLPARPATAETTTTVGQDWDTVVIVSNPGSLGGLRGFLDSAIPVTVGGTTGRLVTSRLVNVLVLDDGRIAVGAVTPQELEHAVAGH